jgi:cell wall-associated NlpC family hydrolase
MPADTSLTILGPSSLTAAQLQAWAARNGKGNGRLNCTLDQLIAWYISEGDAQGVRGDVAFAQACLETGWFTNSDTARNNFAGIAHYDNAPAGLDFPSPQIGVRAQVQLLAKVTGDTRFGHPDVAPNWAGRQTFTWGGLSSNWATDPNYGRSVIAVYNSLLGGNPVLNTDPGSGFAVAVDIAGPPAAQPTGDAFTVTNVGIGQIPGIDPNFQADGMVTAQTFRWPLGVAPTGSSSPDAIAAAVSTESTVDLAHGQLSEIQLTVIDPDRSLTAGLPGTINQDSGYVGQYAIWGADVMVLAECQTLDTDRVPSMVLTLRTGCLQWMATKRVQRVWDGLSATQWIESAVSEYNAQLPKGVPAATFLGQPTAPYAGGIMANPSMPVTQWQSYYDIAQQLCFDEGCWLFESGGCVVFGQPEWIATVAPTVKIGYRGLTGYKNGFPADSAATEALNYPNCLRSCSVFTGDTLQVDVPRALGEQMRVGQQIELSGVPDFSAKKWIVTGVQFPFDGGQTPVQITANEAKNPIPAAPGGVAPSPPQTDPTGHAPIPTNLQFVQTAETQTGKPYLWGGESPSAGFDCSGLVQWALQQLGITFPRTTGEQYAACAKVAGADKGPALAALINGALLFKNSSNGATAGEHVAISLGKTRNGDTEVLVFQAPYTGAYVSSAWVNISYFDEGAIIPQLNYGSNAGAAA